MKGPGAGLVRPAVPARTGDLLCLGAGVGGFMSGDYRASQSAARASQPTAMRRTASPSRSRGGMDRRVRAVRARRGSPRGPARCRHYPRAKARVRAFDPVTLRPHASRIAATAIAADLPIYACTPDAFTGIDGLDLVALAIPPARSPREQRSAAHPSRGSKQRRPELGLLPDRSFCVTLAYNGNATTYTAA